MVVTAPPGGPVSQLKGSSKPLGSLRQGRETEVLEKRWLGGEVEESRCCYACPEVPPPAVVYLDFYRTIARTGARALCAQPWLAGSVTILSRTEAAMEPAPSTPPRPPDGPRPIGIVVAQLGDMVLAQLGKILAAILPVGQADTVAEVRESVERLESRIR